MQLTRDKDNTALLVRACEPGSITIGETVVTTNLLVTADRLQTDWPVTAPNTLTAADFEAALATEPELILLGTGDELVFPDQAVTAALLGQGVGFEVMDTRAACRTYNVLVMDRRPVVAALIQLSAK